MLLARLYQWWYDTYDILYDLAADWMGTTSSSEAESDASPAAAENARLPNGARDPYQTWRRYKRNGHERRSLLPLPLDTPVHEDKVRFVCISDTHDRLDEMADRIPPGDVLIHAGDFTDDGDLHKVAKFASEMRRLPHRFKVVIAGNHELGFEKPSADDTKELRRLALTDKRQLLTGLIYLQDTSITLYDYKLYGAPWHPMPYYDFHVPRGDALKAKWRQIPDDTDVLITHTPPLGHGDLADWNIKQGLLAGCADLLDAVEDRVRPLYHVFGHIHSRHGLDTNGPTTFVNASSCDRDNRPVNRPILFDLPLKPGQRKVMLPAAGNNS